MPVKGQAEKIIFDSLITALQSADPQVSSILTLKFFVPFPFVSFDSKSTIVDDVNLSFPFYFCSSSGIDGSSLRYQIAFSYQLNPEEYVNQRARSTAQTMRER